MKRHYYDINMLWLKSDLKGVLFTYMHTYVYTCNVICTCVRYVCVHVNICFVLVYICAQACPVVQWD